MVTKERLNFVSPLDEKNLAFLVTASQFYRYLHEEPCGYCLIFNLLHSRYGLRASLLSKAATKDLKLLYNFTSTSKSVFFFQRQKTKTFKTDLEKCYQCSVSIDISLDLKVYFSQVMYEINSLITILLSNQIHKISAQWWIRN